MEARLRRLSVALLLLAVARAAAPQSILTVAGGGSDDGRPARSVGLFEPEGLTRDAAGNLYIADAAAHLVRRVDSTTGLISTIAGVGGAGFSGDGGLATKAALFRPRDVAVDASGHVYIADGSNNRVRRVDARTGVITTIAGTGEPASTGDGGPATQAAFSQVTGLALDGRGHLVVVSSGTHQIRRIALETGLVTTIAGIGEEGFGGDGGPATAARLYYPSRLALDAAGNIFVADGANARVRRIDASTGLISTVAGTGAQEGGADGLPATLTPLGYPSDVALDAAGNLYIADYGDNRVRFVDARTGLMSTVAGGGEDYPVLDGGPATSFSIASIAGLTLDATGTALFLSEDGEDRVYRVKDGVIQRVAGGGSFLGDGGPATAAILRSPASVLTRPAAFLIADALHGRVRRVSRGEGSRIVTVAGNGDSYSSRDGLPSTQSGISLPLDVAVDGSGGLYIVAAGESRVLYVDPAGSLSRYAGSEEAGFTGDGGPARDASLSFPTGLDLDGSGALYIADANNHRVRRVDKATGVITTVAGSGPVGFDNGAFEGDGGPATAARFAFPLDVAVDAAGNLFIADQSNSRVRRVEAATGVVTTYAGGGEPEDGLGDGGPATLARLSQPAHLALDAAGNLYVADTDNHRVRRVAAASGVITTVAGSGPTGFESGGFEGDGGPATAARLNQPEGVAVDALGNVFIADTASNRVRVVSGCAPVTPPSLSAPADAATAVATAPELSWQPVPGAFRYDVLLGRGARPTAIAGGDLTVTSLSLSNLEPGVTYAWQVVAKGDPYCSPLATSASPVRSFTTATACAAPPPVSPLLPAAGATTPATVDLSWQAAPGASSYDLYLGPSDPPSLRSQGITATSFQVSGLAPGSTYRWFVVARATCDATQTSRGPVRSFTVAGSCDTPGAFAPASPADGAADVSASPTLSWSASAGAASYDLFFGTAPDPPLYLANLPGTSLPISGLSPGASYFWRVVARVPCDAARSASTAVARFTVGGQCLAAAAPSLTFVPPGAVGAGQTYAIGWQPAAGLDAGGSYLVERSLAADFATVLDAQSVTGTFATFVSAAPGTVHHRVRAVAGCNPQVASPPSQVRAVTITAGAASVVFTLQPGAVVTQLGEALEDRTSRFVVENLGRSPVQVLLGRQEIGSVPFFTVADPLGGDAAIVTLEPRSPKTFELRFSGPPNDEAGAYQGIVFLAGIGAPLAVTPYAFVNLKVGGAEEATPVFLRGGQPTEYAAFPGYAGDDAGRPPIEVSVQNPGTAPMELGAEIGPELWLVPETGWNATPIPPGETRTLRLFAQRGRAPNGSALPRYTYLTVRTRSGRSARLLVQDTDAAELGTGRGAALAPGATSFLVPSVVNGPSRIGGTFVSRLRLSNAGSEAVQAELAFTPRDADGFDPAAVVRATLLVPPNDAVVLTDPLVQLFGLAPPVSGSLEVRVPPERAGLLTVSSGVDAPARTGGAFGFQMPVFRRGEGAALSRPHLLTGITSTAAYRTNLILAETTGVDQAKVRVTLYGRDGVRRGDTVVDVPRYGQKQISGIVGALGGEADFEAGRLELVVEAGGGSAGALVTVIDNANDDAVTYVSRPLGAAAAQARRQPLSWAQATGTLKQVVPALVNGFKTFPGTEQPYTFRSLIGFASATLAPASFTLTYHDLQTGQRHTRSVTVQPRQTLEYRNALVELFGLAADAPSQGPLFVESDPGGLIYCKVYSDLGSGSLGDAFPVVPLPYEATTGAGSATPVLIEGLEQSADRSRGTRSNLILNEVSGAGPSTVSVRLYEAGNRSQPIAERELVINPLEKVQLSTVFGGLGLDQDDRRKDRANVLCVVTAKSGSGLVTAIITTIDNRTGDTRNALLTPGGGVPVTGSGSIGF